MSKFRFHAYNLSVLFFYDQSLRGYPHSCNTVTFRKTRERRKDVAVWPLDKSKAFTV